MKKEINKIVKKYTVRAFRGFYCNLSPEQFKQELENYGAKRYVDGILVGQNDFIIKFKEEKEKMLKGFSKKK